MAVIRYDIMNSQTWHYDCGEMTYQNLEPHYGCQEVSGQEECSFSYFNTADNEVNK